MKRADERSTGKVMLHPVHDPTSSWRTTMERRGLTLMEVLTSVAIIGIVASASVAYFGVAVARARWDSAQNILLTIYAGEQVYYGLNATAVPRRYYPAPSGTLSAACFTAACLNQWRNNIYCDNPNDSAIPANRITYQVQSFNTNPPTFLITATYFRNGVAIGTITVNQDRVFGGTWARP